MVRRLIHYRCYGQEQDFGVLFECRVGGDTSNSQVQKSPNQAFLGIPDQAGDG
jgi:hypothetical protein